MCKAPKMPKTPQTYTVQNQFASDMANSQGTALGANSSGYDRQSTSTRIDLKKRPKNTSNALNIATNNTTATTKANV